MKIRVETDTSALASLYTGLTSVASGDTAREIARRAASDIQGKLIAQFARGVDPYGNRWPRPKDGGKPGDRTGTLKGNVEAFPLGPRIQLRSTVPYAGFFHRGTVKMKARPIFPTAGGGVPPAWKKAIEQAARRVIARRLKARGGR